MVYLFLANGFEEVEAFTSLDYLRRAGILIQSVGITGKTVTGAHGITVCADIDADAVDFKQMELVILPGGMPGTQNLEQSALVQDAIDVCVKKGAVIAAICAAPSLLGHRGLLEGREVVCFPSVEKQLGNANLRKDAVWQDGRIITSRGAGTAQQFAFAIIKELAGEQKSDEIKAEVQWQD